jgi:8-oxo-dGTP diphosphatase
MAEIKTNVAVKVVIEDGKGNIVLGKRKFEPDAGTWDAPGGLVEFGERLEQAGVREVKEETGLDVKMGELIDAQERIEVPRRHTVLLYFKGKLVGGTLAAGDDVAEAKWMPLKSVRHQENLRPIFLNVLGRMGA